jgi:hypothetical protein
MNKKGRKNRRIAPGLAASILGLRVPDSPASLFNLERTLLAGRDLYGFYGNDTGHRRQP